MIQNHLEDSNPSLNDQTSETMQNSLSFIEILKNHNDKIKVSLKFKQKKVQEWRQKLQNIKFSSQSESNSTEEDAKIQENNYDYSLKRLQQEIEDLENKTKNYKKMNKLQKNFAFFNFNLHQIQDLAFFKHQKRQFNENVQKNFQMLLKSVGNNINSKKEAKKLEKQFKHLFFNNNEKLDLIDEYIYKKHKVNDQLIQIQPRQIGYKISDFLKIKQYSIQTGKLPQYGFQFDEIKQNNNIIQNDKSRNKNQLFKNQKNSNQSTQIIEQDVNLFVNPIKHQLQTKELNTETYSSLSIIPQKSKEQEIAKEKVSKLSQEKLDEIRKNLLKKSWEKIIQAILKAQWLSQKEKIDKELNSKKIALSCAKEIRRKYYKSQKVQKEHLFRAKRLHKEMQSYWRKKERELNEIRKKKQKLEIELRRREEEERETLLQKKRLEFLMTQSSFYSQYMAKKLGLTEEYQPNKPIIQVDEQAALENVQHMIKQKQYELQFYDEGKQQSLNVPTIDDLKNINKMDFSQMDQNFNTIFEPKMFLGQLKGYQLKGLRWLDNLYDQGINGILADEMGLGKTIQAIALLSHLFENKNNYGPFLIVAPSSTLYNWQSELKKFAPKMNVLPYWGNIQQRKTLRKFFYQKQMGYINSPFHVIITSYQLIVSDDKAFHRLKWQYMILDEAQAIKNVQSQRWKSLLSFNSRNRLLLTGTPIQNTMAELWALLHFIMPKLFDSHEQFQEWFSKDIEAHSQQQGVLNQQQLQRLHAILKPFMLRRVKKDVEHELGQKKEYHISCEMTKRQQLLYNVFLIYKQSIKGKISIKDFFMMIDSKQKHENLMNLVMQFRKVCNHPELFERRPVQSPFFFSDSVGQIQKNIIVYNQIREVYCNINNPIIYQIPVLVYDEILSDDFKIQFIRKKFNIFQNTIQNKTFSFMKFTNLNQNVFKVLFNQGQLFLACIMLHFFKNMNRKIKIYDNDLQRYMFWIDKIQKIIYLNAKSLFKKQIQDIELLLPYNQKNLMIYQTKVLASPIQNICASSSFNRNNKLINQQIILSSKFKFSEQFFYQLNLNQLNNYEKIVQKRKLINTDQSLIQIPNFQSMVADSSKLKYLDQLLKRLKSQNHRVLIFCQMTKMIDILEEYVSRMGYKYFRLDGRSNIADRRDMVVDFQTQDDIFCFLLSTRAGGLGVTLTAADTVIFYDNDWNPTMDAQATDRAHRIGQDKEVSVYRLVTKDTIEERIVKRAQQKQNVQTTVYSGGAFKADIFKTSEVMELLFDENEIQGNEAMRFMSKGGQKKKSKKAKKYKKIQQQDIEEEETEQNNDKNDIDLDFTEAFNQNDD